jgi:hypothetical protein
MATARRSSSPCEAKRIDLAFLFDPMMAVHTSNVEPLPHQITAVYESMLPRQPLRFVLADDPGAGKTIMAGLYIRELIMRADARRILIVAPGSLVEQWRDELFEKFGLEFRIFSPPGSRPRRAATPSRTLTTSSFASTRSRATKRATAGEALRCRLGPGRLRRSAQARRPLLRQQAGRRPAASSFAEKLGAHTRHLLLMTATPHNGKEEDFQLFLSLLDSDRFYGKFRDGVHKVDCSDLMRRMVKEELVKFDGTPLFPERKRLHRQLRALRLEAALYEAVTQYVKTEMGKADQLDGKRKGLGRLRAHRPPAPPRLQPRGHLPVAQAPPRGRLERRLREEKLGIAAKQLLAETSPTCPEDDDDLNAEEQEDLEETWSIRPPPPSTIAELEAEIVILQGLGEQQAKASSRPAGSQVGRALAHPAKRPRRCATPAAGMRKIIIFSEHRDTLNYLHEKIAGVLGNPDAIVTIHGGTHRDERRKRQALFRSDPDIRVLVATDAAGEGVNLQNANLMVNYDLPWNPNRLEQRFGRIHRIGQQEVCHLWNLVAKETREGDVYHRLLEKLASRARRSKAASSTSSARSSRTRAQGPAAPGHPLRRPAGGARPPHRPSTTRSTTTT